MAKKAELACGYFQKGYNCAQAVFAAFCEGYDVEKELAFRVAGGFGGGMRVGEVCGAAAGAVMVVGLKYGHFKEGDFEAKRQCNAKTEELLDRFAQVNGALTCRALLGHDTRTEQAAIQEKNLYATTCMGLIASAADILEELGY